MRWALLLIVLLLVGCDIREPTTRGQAMSQADNWLQHKELDWGPIDHVWPPDGSLMDGRSWWQVDYLGTTELGAPRVVLVDAETGWARFPPPDFRPRVRLAIDAEAALPVGPTTLAPGSWLAVVARSDGAPIAPDALREAAASLNGLAAGDGVPRLFTVRELARGSQLVYGWDGDRGIAQDAALSDWLAQRSTYRVDRWISLGE